MSRKVATLVYSKQVGSMARKAVLAYFADRANDDGSGIWTAKQRVADEIECSKQTVITVVKGLLADGLIREDGHRANGNGYTVEYSIDLAAVEALQDSKIDGEEVQNLTGPELDGSTSLTPRGQAALPKPSLNRPPQKASPSSVARAKPKAGSKAKFIVPGWVPAEPWAAFVEMRRDTGHKLTDRAKVLAIGELERLRDAGNDPAAVLNQSTMKAWRGLFEVKGGGGAPPAGRSLTGAEMAHAHDETAARFDRLGRADDAAEQRRLAERARRAQPVGKVAAAIAAQVSI